MDGVEPIQGGGSHMASVLDELEFKPHLGGDEAHYSRGVIHGAGALASNGMLPRYGFGEVSTQALKE